MKKCIVFVVLLLMISSTALAYVGNKRTMKFHDDDCYWVTKMAEYNKVEIDSREEAIQSGYKPCKACKP